MTDRRLQKCADILDDAVERVRRSVPLDDEISPRAALLATMLNSLCPRCGPEERADLVMHLRRWLDQEDADNATVN
jgi:hypothetical protein